MTKIFYVYIYVEEELSLELIHGVLFCLASAYERSGLVSTSSLSNDSSCLQSYAGQWFLLISRICPGLFCDGTRPYGVGLLREMKMTKVYFVCQYCISTCMIN